MGIIKACKCPRCGCKKTTYDRWSLLIVFACEVCGVFVEQIADLSPKQKKKYT